MSKKNVLLLPAFFLSLLLSACSSDRAAVPVPGRENSAGVSEMQDETGFLRFLDEEPNILDPQLTSEYYTVPLNVFDRLVEVKTVNGQNELVPSLAESWDISDDGLTYTFRLREGVKFSNGSVLTADDVAFTFHRLLTDPDSHSKDLVMSILGAEDLRNRKTDSLAGFRKIDDLSFEITLEYPYGPFLACLSAPGASILDEETVLAAGADFGRTAADTVGTGPFILSEWRSGDEIIMVKNPGFWGQEAKCEGLRMMFLNGSVSPLKLFENGELDILDLERVGSAGEYFINGDIYRARLVRGNRVGITYIAMNGSVEPLNDVRVRRALQLGLDRTILMKAMISGRGNVENGIFPYGLLGHDPMLSDILYDPEEALCLLSEAGYPDGFDLNFYYSVEDESTDLEEIAAYMWGKIGVSVSLIGLEDDEFLAKRRAGELSCYSSTWSADYNDPDNFIYTFFGTAENTLSRSLCYADENVIRRIQSARAIVDETRRIAEYQALEKKIVQEDAAWIPLYSSQHLFVVSPRVHGFEVSWNGWSSTRYDNVSLEDDPLMKGGI